jgi:DedD protein
MASTAGKRSGGGSDRVVEGRHLIGVFLGVVILCGVFFTLGYVMGRTQPDAALGVASAANREASRAKAPEPKPESKPQPGATPATSAPPEWDFYPASGSAKPAEHLSASAGKTAASRPPAASHSPGPSAPAKPSAAVNPAASKLARFKPPLIPRGAYVLQVAALAKDADALAMADALQQKHFPAFVLAPTTDTLYRVQVGPYADSKSAEMAKHSLEREGFKTILKR